MVGTEERYRWPFLHGILFLFYFNVRFAKADDNLDFPIRGGAFCLKRGCPFFSARFLPQPCSGSCSLRSFQFVCQQQ